MIFNLISVRVLKRKKVVLMICFKTNVKVKNIGKVVLVSHSEFPAFVTCLLFEILYLRNVSVKKCLNLIKAVQVLMTPKVLSRNIFERQKIERNSFSCQRKKYSFFHLKTCLNFVWQGLTKSQGS